MLVFTFSIFLLTGFSLTGCAHSSVSRNAAALVDQDVEGVESEADSLTNGNTADAYQNTSQATKGAIVGGATGAMVGAITGLSYGIGVLPGTLFGTTAGVVVGTAIGASIDARTNTRDKLENRGASVVVLGDQILIVIPSARVFNPYSTVINPEAYSTLMLIAAYVNRYTKMLVKISVYTANTGACTTDLALSQAEAQKLAKFLQACNLDARILYSQGYGGIHQVTGSTNWDSDNYRIEITFQKLYV